MRLYFSLSNHLRIFSEACFIDSDVTFWIYLKATFDPKKHIPKIIFFTVKNGSISFEGLKVFILKDMILIVKVLNAP